MASCHIRGPVDGDPADSDAVDGGAVARETAAAAVVAKNTRASGVHVDSVRPKLMAYSRGSRFLFPCLF
jgi:hypothetical protein